MTEPLVSEPFESVRGLVSWAEMADFARKHPGQWCVTPVSMSPSTAVQLKMGKYRHVKPEEFEITRRRDPDDRAWALRRPGGIRTQRCWVYIRSHVWDNGRCVDCGVSQ